MIIVIDGLSGSGKSTTARAVAEILGIEYLDSGALYRAVTWIWLEEGRPEDETFSGLLASKDVQFEYRDRAFVVCVDSRDISSEIRRPAVSDEVSRIAAMKEVRRFVNRLMTNSVAGRYFIADGRDLGSSVFPDADLKFFMKASLERRAERRFAELEKAEDEVTLEQVRENLQMRDHADQSREADPMVVSPDAYIIDTSEKTFDEQVEEIIAVIRKETDLKM